MKSYFFLSFEVKPSLNIVFGQDGEKLVESPHPADHNPTSSRGSQRTRDCWHPAWLRPSHPSEVRVMDFKILAQFCFQSGCIFMLTTGQFVGNIICSWRNVLLVLRPTDKVLDLIKNLRNSFWWDPYIHQKTSCCISPFGLRCTLCVFKYYLNAKDWRNGLE